MENGNVTIYALGTAKPWIEAYEICKISHLKVDLHLFFSDEWEIVLQSHIRRFDPEVNLISYIGCEMQVGLDYYRSLFGHLNTLNDEKHLHKFSRYLGNYKKYVQWDISIDRRVESIIIELDFEVCPRTCENFWQICTSHSELSYKNSKFHRAVNQYFIEGGLLEKEMHSIYRDYFPDENYNYKHDKPGVIGMSKVPNCQNGTAFYITLKPIRYFDGRLVAFGRVVSGMDTILKISRSQCSNQQIISEIPIKDSKNYFGKDHANDDFQPQTTGFRDIANEMLKYI